MSNSFSVIDLLLDAPIVVQLVMALLLVVSIVSWGIIFQRGSYLSRVKSAYDSFERKFWSGVDLTQTYREGNAPANDGKVEGVENIFRAGFKEFSRLRQQANVDTDTIIEGSQRAMRIAVAREQEKLEANLPFLASVASVSPYVGLFATVWGIMITIMTMGQENVSLANIAPGIAEALIATAMGLFAAIPAVLAYNRFAARVEWLMNNYQTFAEEFSSILHRQLHG